MDCSLVEDCILAEEDSLAVDNPVLDNLEDSGFSFGLNSRNYWDSYYYKRL